jgi:hypothetical protein
MGFPEEKPHAQLLIRLTPRIALPLKPRGDRFCLRKQLQVFRAPGL